MPLERNDLCPCGSGIKYKKCHGLPGATPLDVYRLNRAIAYAGRIGKMREEFCLRYDEFKQFTIADMDKRLREDVASKGKKISCSAGCPHCCSLYVFATLEEAECIIYYLYQHEQALLNFLISYNEKWRCNAAIQRSLPMLIGLQGKSLKGDLSPEEQKLFDSQMTEYFKQNLPCPFLADGSCTIYPVRPFVCAGVVATTPREWCACGNEHFSDARFSRLELKQTSNMPYFLKDKNSVSYGCLPDLVHRLLERGYGWLEIMTEAQGLYQEIAQDPEVAGILKALGASLPV
jgi:Fe-S-cluster containining protein